MNQTLRQILIGLLLILLQVFLFNQMTLFDGQARPYVFLIFLLFFPLEMPVPVQYLVGFGVGLMIDIFSLQGPIGLHAFSATLIMGIRAPLISLIGTSTASARNTGDVQLTEQQGVWYLTYLLPLILIYVGFCVFLEAMSFSQFWRLLGKVTLSGLYTFFVCMILWYLFYRRS